MADERAAWDSFISSYFTGSPVAVPWSGVAETLPKCDFLFGPTPAKAEQQPKDSGAAARRPVIHIVVSGGAPSGDHRSGGRTAVDQVFALCQIRVPLTGDGIGNAEAINAENIARLLERLIAAKQPASILAAKGVFRSRVERAPSAGTSPGIALINLQLSWQTRTYAAEAPK